MPVEFDIRENGHVLFYTMHDPWSLSDFAAHSAQERAYRLSVPFPVHQIVDISHARLIPNGILRGRQAPTFKDTTSGFLAVIGPSVLVRALTDTIARLAHFDKLKYFESEAAALEFIRHEIANEPRATPAQNEAAKS